MPFTFGKKCPNCRGKNNFPLRHKSWPCHLPGVQYFTCTTCGQDFFYIPPCSIFIDKRSNERIKPPSCLLVRIQGEQSQFGRIKDISMEGIGFSYDLDQQKFARENFTIDLYNCKQGTMLRNLPINVVSSRVNVKSIAGKPTTILCNGARFGKLNRIQKKILQDFIDGFSS